MPIRTKLTGVLAMICLMIGSLIFGLMGHAETVSARAATGKSYSAKTSTTKGVRTKTARQKRRPGAKQVKAKQAYASTYTVALPPEKAASASSQEIADKARQLVGSRYKWGGKSRETGFDCSGLVQYTYGDKAGNLPHSAHGLYTSVRKVDNLQPGDIVFFGRRRGRVTHAAIYVGNGKIIHASTPRRGVLEDDVRVMARHLGLRGVGRVI